MERHTATHRRDHETSPPPDVSSSQMAFPLPPMPFGEAVEGDRPLPQKVEIFRSSGDSVAWRMAGMACRPSPLGARTRIGVLPAKEDGGKERALPSFWTRGKGRKPLPRSAFPMAWTIGGPERRGARREGTIHRSRSSDQSFGKVSRPFWKRPACDFSAFASVSNHSAISLKPSSRATLAKPGYISVNS